MGRIIDSITKTGRIEFSTFTANDVTLAVSTIEDAIRRDPKRYLDDRVTPFATVRQLMGGSSPPSRWWSPFWRILWFERLHHQLRREIERQVAFAKRITGERQ